MSLPGFVKYSNGNARIEGDLMSFVERITGEEGEFRRGDWERFGGKFNLYPTFKITGVDVHLYVWYI